jgi:putative ABC transport system permease protein
MRTLLEFLRRLTGSLRTGRTDADLEEELRVHLELAAEREAARGHSPAAAARRARLQAGSLAVALEPLRDQRGLRWLDALRADVVFGWRQIARHRIASVAAVLSIGLAMGAALAAFRLVDAVLLRPLPVADPSRLFVVTKTSLNMEQVAEERDDFDYPTYRRYVERSAGHADLMLLGMASRSNIVIGAGEPEPAVRQFVSGNVFATLGLEPALGRLLGPGDDAVPGGHPVAVLSYDYWQRRYGGDPAVIGRTFRVVDRVYTIVGVVSRGFIGTEPGTVTDLFLPSMMNPDALNADGWSWFRIWLRPKPGVDSAEAQAVLQAGFRIDQAERAKRFAPDTPKSRIDAMLGEQLFLRRAVAGASGTQKTFRQPLLILAALATLLVLMACANVANLLLAQAISRRLELTLRLSIGAARHRLVQLLLVESSLLAITAAAVGVMFAWRAAPIVVGMLAPPDRPVRLNLDLDWRALFVAAALTCAVTMLFGLAPAVRGSAAPLVDTLKEVRGWRTHRRLADALVAAQTAFCVFLLFGASLFVGTLEHLQGRPLGFVPGNLLHLSVEGARARSYEEWMEMAAALRDVPRVTAAAVAGWAPLTGNRWRSSVTRPGHPSPESAPDWVSVGPGYFETMQMRLIEGRDFRSDDRPPGRDDAGRPVAGVAVVNETFARTYFDGRSPVGRSVMVDASRAPMEIVGMTADAVYFSVREANHPAVFIPFAPKRQGATILVRTEGDAPDLPQALRREIRRLDPGLQVWEAAPFQSLVTQQMIRERLLAVLSAFFATLALVLAVIGIYSVLNYAVTRERREIGLRLALGARPGHVVTMLTTRLAGIVLLGALAGLGLGLASVRYVESLLFHVAPTDFSALAPPIVVLSAAGLLAVLPAAIRAVSTDPAQTIRTEGA